MRFWKELGGAPAVLTGDLVKRLEDYEWPGNVRELRNVLAQKIALGDVATRPSPVNPSTGHDASDADPIEAVLEQELPFPIARDKILDIFEQRYVARVLRRHSGNVTHAARASGIGRRYFQTIRGRLK
jgi:two-component system response regulator HydG